VFSNKVEVMTPLIPLDPAGKQEVLETMRVRYKPSPANGTALFYAEHTALANL